jgi:hypothetical protein
MKLKARRGAVVVMLGIMMVALVSVTAVAIDFSRMWTLRNDLQTAADAAAHAAAIQLLPPNNAAVPNIIAAATSYATVNKAMTRTASVDSVILGDWDNVPRTFTPGAPHTDAVSVTVSRQSTGLIMGLVGVAAPRLKARAIAWADAPVVTSAGCMKPVAVPYEQMIWRLNIKRGIANTPDTLGMYRRFDPVNDMVALSNMTAAERTFTLKIGSGNNVVDTLGQISGSYQAVRLGKAWDVSTGLDASPGPDNGGNAYSDHLSGSTCHTLAVGDSLQLEGGNKVGPTICGVIGNANCNSASGPGICASLPGATDNTKPDETGFGECRDAQNNVGIDIKAAFYNCAGQCNGTSNRVEVSLLGSFTLTHMYPGQSKQNQTPSFEQSQIVGIFKPVSDPGTVGPGQTTLVKPILVR